MFRINPTHKPPFTEIGHIRENELVARFECSVDIEGVATAARRGYNERYLDATRESTTVSRNAVPYDWYSKLKPARRSVLS
jgi:hypothetical protein